MNCKSCGNPLTLEDKFCKKCGTPVEMTNNVNNPVAQPMPASSPIPEVAPAPVAQPVAQPAPAPVAQPMQQPMGPAPAAPTGPAPVNGPMPMGPAPMPGMMGGQPMPQQQKGGMNIILIIILVVALGVGGFFAIKALTGKDEGGSGGGGSVATSTNKVNYEGYTFDVPTDFTSEKGQGLLILQNQTTAFTIEILDLTYGSYTGEQFLANMKQNGFSGSYAGEKTYNGTKYHLFTGTHNGMQMAVVIMPLQNTKVIISQIINSSYTNPSQSTIDTALKVLVTGTYTGSHSMADDKEFTKIGDSLIEKEETNTGDYFGIYDDEDTYETTYVELDLDY